MRPSSTEDGTWYILVHTKCKHLRDDNLCGIYETRPQICRDYTTDNCEYERRLGLRPIFLKHQSKSPNIRKPSWQPDGLFRSPKPKLLPLLEMQRQNTFLFCIAFLLSVLICPIKRIIVRFFERLVSGQN